MMKKPEDIPLFFIIGRPRTGSTLLRFLFDAHPNVQIPLECQFVINLSKKYARKKFWTRKDILSFHKDLLKEFLFDTWTIDRNKLRNELLLLEGECTYAKVCRMVYLNYQSLYPKKEIQYIGDKNPGYTLYPDKLSEIFPGSKFIYLNRDYRDNYVSLAGVDFEIPWISYVTYKWKYFFRRYEKFKRKHPDKVFYIKYEDLVSDPAGRFGELCRFIGLPEVDDVHSYFEKKEEFLKMYPQELALAYFENLTKPINKSRVEVWREKLSERQVKIADHIISAVAERAGYQQQYHEFSFSLKLQVLPGILAARLLYAITWIVNLFPYRLREFILSRLPFYLGRVFKRK